MDTSAEYIKMCERAKEIQEIGRDAVAGNYYQTHSQADGDIPPYIHHRSRHDISKAYSAWIWLPRQDQLQEMLNTHFGGTHPAQLIRALEIWLSELYDQYHKSDCKEDYLWKINGSCEQLWLAFVMKEKYNKTWDGLSEKWPDET